MRCRYDANHPLRGFHMEIECCEPDIASRAMGIGLRWRPELAVLSPLSLALLCDDRLSRLLKPRSESRERFAAPMGPFTAFLRWRGDDATDVAEAFELECEWEDEDATLPLPRFEGESVKRGSQECEWLSASEPSVDVDQRERSTRSAAASASATVPTSDTVDAVRCTGLRGLSGATERSKSKEERGDDGVLIADAWEYTLALIGVLGHCGRSRSGRTGRSSVGLSTSSGKSTSAGTEERGGGRAPTSHEVGDMTMKWLLGEGGTEVGDGQRS